MNLKKKLFGNYVHNEENKLVCILTGANCTDEHGRNIRLKLKKKGKEKENKKKKITVQCLYKYIHGKHMFLKRSDKKEGMEKDKHE